jgi:hypothetical protein
MGGIYSFLSIVMAGHSRPQDGVAIHISLRGKDVDARDKPGHDGGEVIHDYSFGNSPL